MIDPRNITRFDRSPAELQELLLFAISVAGKTASVQAKKLDEFLAFRYENTPFQYIRELIRDGYLKLMLATFGLGQYNRLYRAFSEILQFEGRLDTVTTEELERVFGVGKKTSRFFVLHSRPNQKYCVLDVHVLKYMREKHLAPNIPKATPSGKNYDRLEKVFLKHCEDLGVKDIAEFDLKIWKNGVDKRPKTV